MTTDLKAWAKTLTDKQLASCIAITEATLKDIETEIEKRNLQS